MAVLRGVHTPILLWINKVFAFNYTRALAFLASNKRSYHFMLEVAAGV